MNTLCKQCGILLSSAELSAYRVVCENCWVDNGYCGSSRHPYGPITTGQHIKSDKGTTTLVYFRAWKNRIV